jgi:carboxyl-terminal processing protease
MEELLNRYEPQAKAAKDEATFEKAVNDMIDEFKDSHFDLYTKSDQGYYVMDALTRGSIALPMPNIGAWFAEGPDGYTVQMLLENGEAAEAGLSKGDKVVKVDGLPFLPIQSFKGKKDKTVDLEFVHQGKTRKASVKVDEEDGGAFFLEGTRKSERMIEVNGKKYGYIHLWTMGDEAQKNALAGAVYGKFKDTDGFILDIRDGFGGRPEGYGDPFFRPEIHLDWTMPNFVNHQLFGYQRPLVILINKGSRSAKEVFAYIMKKSGRATLIGEQTGGNVLGTSPMRLGDWGYLEIPAVDVSADGDRLEKNGVAPDVKVSREFDDSGKDLYIDQAVKVLAEKLAAKK